MNCLVPSGSPGCQCKCTCGRRKNVVEEEINGGKREKQEGKKENREEKSSYFDSFLQRIQQNFCRSERNKNRKYSNKSKGRQGSKISYQKLAQRESEITMSSIQSDSETSPSIPPETSTTSTSTPLSLKTALSNNQVLWSAMEDYWDWGEEELTCPVCDRSFTSPWDLEKHMIKRRHWLCGGCEQMFNSVMQLEHHKETHGHWSDDEYDILTDDDSDEDHDFDINVPEFDIEEETVFGPEADKTILLCNEF